MNTFDATEILPNELWLGDMSNADDFRNLDLFEITHVLNVAGDLPPKKFPEHITSLHVPLSDFGASDLNAALETCFNFIAFTHQRNQRLTQCQNFIHQVDSARKEKKKVLIHCISGINRSPSITIAYLMRENKAGLEEAYEYVKQRRNKISPHMFYMRQLIQYEKNLLGFTPFEEGKLPFAFMRHIRQLPRKKEAQQDSI